MKTDVWVARDVDGDVWIFLHEPHMVDGEWRGSTGKSLNYVPHEYLAPGECRKATMPITLDEEGK